jgi:hypothetical protein
VQQPLSSAAVAVALAGKLDGTAAGLNFKMPELQRRWLLGDGPDLVGYTSQQVVGLLCTGAVQSLVSCRPVCKYGEVHTLSEWWLDVCADLQ